MPTQKEGEERCWKKKRGARDQRQRKKREAGLREKRQREKKKKIIKTKRQKSNKKVIIFYEFVATIDCQRWHFTVVKLLKVLSIKTLMCLTF